MNIVTDAVDIAATDRLDLLALDEALQKLERHSPRKAQLVKLRFFAGLTLEETAKVLGVAVSTASADWLHYSMSSSKNKVFSIDLSRASTLLPDTMTDWSIPLQLTGQSVATQPRNAWYLYSLGIAQHRDGQDEQAILTLQK